jgi:hypothetical protein
LLVLVFEYAWEAPSQVFELPVSMSSVSVDMSDSVFQSLRTFLTSRSRIADTDVGSICHLLKIPIS